MQKTEVTFSVISTIILLCKLQLLTKVCYRMDQLHKGTTFSLIRSIKIQIKGLRKLVRAKTGAEHNKYLSFLKAYYYSGCYNNLEIDMAT